MDVMISVFFLHLMRHAIMHNSTHNSHIIPKMVRSILFSHMAFQVEITPSSINYLIVIIVSLSNSKKKKMRHLLEFRLFSTFNIESRKQFFW